MTPSTSNGLSCFLDATASVRCSVIVPVYKGGTIFEACLASIAAALRDGDELIVVADGEGDGAWRHAERYAAQIVTLPFRSGPSRARNAGAKMAGGDILFFVDADVSIPADCVGKIAAIFAEKTDLAALIGSYDESPGDQSFLSQFKNLFHHYVHQRGGSEASTFWGACGAIRREVFFEIGGFNERYAHPSIEDIELGYRLKAASHRILLARDIQVTHWKKWGAYNLVKTDVLDRAAPWTELILDQIVRNKMAPMADLNLGAAYRISIFASFTFLAVLAAAAFVPAILWTVPFLIGAFVVLHLPLFRFFHHQRGWMFCIKAVFWRFGYDLYSGLGFFYGSSRFAHRESIRMLSQSFAQLDPTALGAGVGLMGGLMIAGATAWVLAGENSPFTSNLELLGNYFPGYGVTFRGGLVGFVYGFGTGFLTGFSIAWLRNTLMRLYLGFRRIKLWTGRFASAQRASD